MERGGSVRRAQVLVIPEAGEVEVALVGIITRGNLHSYIIVHPLACLKGNGKCGLATNSSLAVTDVDGERLALRVNQLVALCSERVLYAGIAWFLQTDVIGHVGSLSHHHWHDEEK